MNRQIRKVAYVILALFAAIFLNLNWLQLVNAQKLAEHPANTRLLIKEYALERGAILSSDQQTLAKSEARPESELQFLRTYPAGPLFAHVTGYYSVRYGRAGLERSYNNILIGEGGVITMQDLGDQLFGRGEKGDTLVTTIDARVQQAATDALAAVGRPAALFAIDPINGDVLANVSIPSFDPNPLSAHDAQVQEQLWTALNADPSKPLLNRATSESYPPGSTFKVVAAAAAIEHGMGPQTSFPATREYQPPQTNRTIGNFGGASCGGDMAEAMRSSCNTYFARLGAEMPAGALEETARGFGFEETPPIDVRAASSNFPALDSPAFAAQSAIGQYEVRATPLQMALVAAAIGNQGRIPVPRLVREVLDARLARVREYQPKIWREAVSPETAGIIRDMMVAVVDRGTGRAAAIPGVRVAGKTGTAQTGRPDGSAHAWFITFAPAEVPRIALAVIVESGGEGTSETGGRVAAPIAKRVIEAHREAAGW